MGTPKRLGAALLLVTGFALGLGGFTFHHARGPSYFKDRPEACLNCHVMRDAYSSWQHSSHREHATCNGCHMPEHPIAGWASKGLNGFLHGAAFTTGWFHEPIQARPFNRAIARGNCLRCHERLVGEMNLAGQRLDELDCVRCHGNVGHRTTLK